MKKSLKRSNKISCGLSFSHISFSVQFLKGSSSWLFQETYTPGLMLVLEDHNLKIKSNVIQQATPPPSLPWHGGGAYGTQGSTKTAQTYYFMLN